MSIDLKNFAVPIPPVTFKTSEITLLMEADGPELSALKSHPSLDAFIRSVDGTVNKNVFMGEFAPGTVLLKWAQIVNDSIGDWSKPDKNRLVYHFVHEPSGHNEPGKPVRYESRDFTELYPDGSTPKEIAVRGKCKVFAVGLGEDKLIVEDFVYPPFDQPAEIMGRTIEKASEPIEPVDWSTVILYDIFSGQDHNGNHFTSRGEPTRYLVTVERLNGFGHLRFRFRFQSHDNPNVRYGTEVTWGSFTLVTQTESYPVNPSNLPISVGNKYWEFDAIILGPYPISK